MNKTKIDWCDHTWNPVYGCNNDCRFCYARKIAKRFAKEIAKNECIFEFAGKILKESEFYNRKYILEKKIRNFQPVWLEKNYQKKFSKKPSKIFVDSMSDIKFWKKEWMNKVLDRIKEYPQHIFMFLTKFPESYLQYEFPENCWLGVSITGIETIDEQSDKYIILSKKKNNLKFVSLEPLLQESFYFFIEMDWLIIGSQTNPYKPPKKEWVDEIIKMSREYNISLFMKKSLKKLYPKLIQEFPKC